jgi:hypothetical protein
MKGKAEAIPTNRRSCFDKLSTNGSVGKQTINDLLLFDYLITKPFNETPPLLVSIIGISTVHRPSHRRTCQLFAGASD